MAQKAKQQQQQQQAAVSSEQLQPASPAAEPTGQHSAVSPLAQQQPAEQRRVLSPVQPQQEQRPQHLPAKPLAPALGTSRAVSSLAAEVLADSFTAQASLQPEAAADADGFQPVQQRRRKGQRAGHASGARSLRSYPLLPSRLSKLCVQCSPRLTSCWQLQLP